MCCPEARCLQTEFREADRGANAAGPDATVSGPARYDVFFNCASSAVSISEYRSSAWVKDFM